MITQYDNPYYRASSKARQSILILNTCNPAFVSVFSFAFTSNFHFLLDLIWEDDG